jgi:HK97 gp10 family phage protein
MTKGFTITGVDGVQKTLDDLAPKYANNLMRATVQGIASEIKKEAARRAPEDTKDLKKSIKARRKKSIPTKPTSVVYVTRGRDAKHNAWYWRFVEYGTSGSDAQEARPFFKPAAEMLKANLNKILTEQFGKKFISLLKREAKKAAKT